jgi:hypothetical protein
MASGPMSMRGSESVSVAGLVAASYSLWEARIGKVIND